MPATGRITTDVTLAAFLLGEITVVEDFISKITIVDYSVDSVNLCGRN